MKVHSLVLMLLIGFAAKSYGQGRLPSADKLHDNVGDTTFDPKIDDPAFHPCNPNGIYQYYGPNTHHKGGSRAIRNYFKSKFRYEATYAGATGYVTIRFVVNCKGQTGWFRILQIDGNYQPVKFNDKLINSLLTLTLSLKNWVPGKWNGVDNDTYYYLNFKLVNGYLKDITP
jgi:hypothetical protein